MSGNSATYSTAESNERPDAPNHRDMAIVNGDPAQLADMALMMHRAGKKVHVSWDNFSTKLRAGDEYEITHYDDHSVIRNADGGHVHVRVRDESHLRVNEEFER